jgi:hypothetical protein
MIFQHAKIHSDESLKCLCVACYEGEILNYEDHVFAISCCIATLIQDARDRGVAVEPLLREYLGAEPESGLTPAQLFRHRYCRQRRLVARGRPAARGLAGGDAGGNAGALPAEYGRGDFKPARYGRAAVRG